MEENYWFRRNRISRRRLLRRAGVVAGAAFIGPLLAACSGNNSNHAASTKPSATSVGGAGGPAGSAAAPSSPTTGKAPTGTLNVIDDLGTERWLLRTATGEMPLLYIGEPLVWWDWEKDEPTNGAILESWEPKQNADGTIDWTFRIKKGVKFHKGYGDVTADDVKFTFTEMLKPGSVNANAKDLTGFFNNDPANLIVDDPYTLRIHSPGPMNMVALFREMSPEEPRTLRPFSRKYFEKVGEDAFAQDPVYAGPYEFASQKPGYDVLLRAVPNHYRTTPGFAELHFFKVLDEATRVQMLQSKQVDVVPVPARQVEGLKGSGIKIVISQNASEPFIGLGGLFPGRPKYDSNVPWAGTNPLDEKPTAVRKALNLAVDRDTIVQKILFGYGRPGVLAFSYIGPGNPWWNPDWKPIPYDPKQAKQILVEAGYPNGFDAKMWQITNFPYSKDVGEAVASMWEKNLGLRIERRVGEYQPTFRTMLVDRDTSGWMYSFQGAPIARPSRYACLNGGPSTQVVVHEELPFYDQICGQIATTTDAKKLVDLERQMGDQEYKYYAEVAVCSLDQTFGLGPKVKSWTPVPKKANCLGLEYAQPA